MEEKIIKVGDNVELKKVGDYAVIITGNNCTVTCGIGCHITCGDDCEIKGGWRSTIKAGKRSYVRGGEESKLSGGLGSALIWSSSSITNKKTIYVDETNTNKVFHGALYGALVYARGIPEWAITEQVEDQNED